MTYNGASGDTQQAMAKALELQGMTMQSVNQANDALKASLENAEPAVQLSIANSLWAKQGISFKPDFLQRNQQFYKAKVTELDFAKPGAGCEPAYGKGRMSLYVFLPKKNTNLDAFQQQLSLQNWQQWMHRFQMRDGAIQLPRFKFDDDIQLNAALQALGMEEAFSDRANFSNMTSASVFIDEVKQKTFVEVNEEGTEAAAVTSVVMAVSD